MSRGVEGANGINERLWRAGEALYSREVTARRAVSVKEGRLDGPNTRDALDISQTLHWSPGLIKAPLLQKCPLSASTLQLAP